MLYLIQLLLFPITDHRSEYITESAEQILIGCLFQKWQLTKWSESWQYENSILHTIELINLCWYYWGGGLYPYRRIEGLEFVCNIDNRGLAGDCARSSYLIWSVTWQKRDCPPTQSAQSSLFALTEEELTQFLS